MSAIQYHPPRLARRILAGCLPPWDREHLMEDYEACFQEMAEEKNIKQARQWYVKQCVKTIPGYLGYRFAWKTGMLFNYLKVGLRNIGKQKIYAFINIGGLALGLSSCLLIFLWVQDEWSFDRFHSKANRIVRVAGEMRRADQFISGPYSPGPLGAAIHEALPDVEQYVTMNTISGFWTVKDADRFIENVHICLTTTGFFDLFDFKMVIGDGKTILEDAGSIIVTEELAHRIFGEEDPLGKTLEVNRRDYQIAGLMQNVPENSHLQFDLLMSARPLLDHPVFSSWQYSGFHTYLLLQTEVDRDVLNAKMTDIYKERMPDIEGKLYIQALKKIHLYSSFTRRDYAVTGNSRSVAVFSVLGLVILAVACINFINLTTARSTARAVEVGMRKVMGANRRMIIRQFFSETFILVCLAMGLALCIAVFLLPVLNRFSEKDLTLKFMNIWIPIIAVGVLWFLTAVIAGSAPAYVMSRFRPSEVLKSGPFRGPGRAGFRRLLILVQFGLSVALIIASFVIHHQLRFIRSKDLGYSRDNLFIMGTVGGFYNNFEGYKAEFLSHPGVESVALGFQPIWDQIRTTSPDWEGRVAGQELAVQCYAAGYDYFGTWGMEVVQGRPFSKVFATDTANVLVNEAAVRMMGLEDPIGKRVTVDGTTGQIIGVVKDFHHASLHHAIQPIFFRLMGSAGFAVKLRSFNEETIEHVKSVWNKAVPFQPFENDVFAPKIEAFYRKERKTAMLVTVLTGLAVVISCLGLLGLISFLAESRTKEIGIRKTLGATVNRLILSLTREFVFLVALANLIAWPAAYLVIRAWLQNYAYRIDMTVGFFILPSVLAMIVAVFTVVFQAWRAASVNPARSLRYE